MANNPIDELSLNINVNDKNSASKINAVADAINNLQRSLASLKNVSNQIQNIQNIFNSVGSFRNSGQTPQLEKIDIADSNNIQSTEELSESMADLGENVRDTATSFREYVKIQKEANKQQNKGEKETKKSSSAFARLGKSIGRVAFYRAIRTALKEIVQAAKEGLQNIREVSPELNKSMNQLSLSATTLKNSFGALITPLVNILAPVFTEIADYIANYVNEMNEATAALEGQDTYVRILTSDTKEYQEQLEKASKAQGGLLSFDTFTKQSGQKKYTGTVKETVKMTKEQAQAYQSINTQIEKLKETLTKVKEIIKELIDIIKDMYEVLNSIGILDYVGRIVDVIKNLADILKGLVKILKGDIPEGMDDIAKAFDKLIRNIFGILIKDNPISRVIKLLGNIFGFDTSFIDSFADSATNFLFGTNAAYANGGNFNTGDFFVANENGATELVASSNTGGGSVMNLDQWASISYSSFYRALSDYNAAQNGRGGELDINSLGRTIAGNTGFVNEMNRRNSSLNLI